MGYQRLKVIFDGPPGAEPGRFVEVEREDGRSVNAGEWEDLGNGMWALCLRVIDEDVKPREDAEPTAPARSRATPLSGSAVD